MSSLQRSATKFTTNNQIPNTFLSLLPGVIILCFLFAVSRYNYLIFHTLAEFFSIIVAWGLFIIVWNTRDFVKNDALVFLGIAYLFIGSLDLFHTLSYKGMGVLAAERGANPATQLWIVARYMEAVTLCAFPFIFGKRIKISIPFGIYSIVSVAALLSIFVWELFPDCYVDGIGLTVFKKSSEYFICAILLAAFFFIYKNKNLLDKAVYKYLAVSIVLTIIGELAFTFYISVYGLSNLIGHFLKIISFYLVYKAIIHTGLKQPYNLLFKEISNKEKRYRQMFETNLAVKLIIDPSDGSIVEANDAACSFYGYSKNEILSLKISDINALSPAKVKEEMSRANSEKKLFFNFPHRLASGEIRDVEVYSGPIKHKQKTFLHSIIIDVTKRNQAEKSLIRKEEKYRALIDDALDSSSVATFILDKNYRVIWVNRAFEIFFGFRKNKVVGRDKRKVIDKKISDIFENPEVYFEKMLSVYEENSFVEKFECKVIPSKGRKERWLEHWCQPIKTGLYAGGRIGHYADITDYKKAVDVLEKSDEKLRKLVSNISDVIVVLDKKGMITYKSPNITEHFGWNPKDLIGKHGLVTVHPDDKERIAKELTTLLEKNSSKAKVEYQYQCKDGSFKPVELTAVNMVNDPIIKGVVANYKDISDRIKAHTELLKSEEKFKSAFFTSPDAINLNHFEDGRYIEINDGFTKIMGYTREDVIGKSSVKLNIWKNLKDRENLVAGLKKYGVVENLEADFVNKEGKIRSGLMSARILRIGSKDTILSITRDITEKKQTERDTQTLVESTVGIIGQDFFDTTVSKLCDWLKCECAIIGEITHDDMVKSVSMIMDGKPVVHYSYSLKGTPCAEVIRKCYCVYPEKVNELFPEDDDLIEMNAEGYVGTILTDKTGKTIGILCAISRSRIDLSTHTQDVMKTIAARVSAEIERRHIEKEKQMLESQLLQAQKMESIGTLAGGIAHDFNNILFPILGHSEMLLADLSKDDPVKESVNEIHSSALRAKELVQQILTFSRQEKGDVKLMKVQPILKEALKMIRSTIPTTIDIKQDIEPKCGAIKADPTQIHQIIMNLLTNAYHAMEEDGGTIEIELKQIVLGKLDLTNPDMEPGNYAWLTVKDTGTGMSQELTEKIFDPFFTTKKEGKGTGMGLSVVHGVIARLNGAVQVYSKPGEGTAFHVYLPIESTTIKSDDTPSEPDIKGGRENILLVDDEQAILTMEKQMLERLGYQVTSRTSSIEALEAFRDNPDKFDLVITDMAMPNMSGDKLAVELKKIKSDVPVLLCTGFSETMTEEKALSLGIKSFLLKPIVMQDLSQKIREVLDIG